MSPFSRHHSSLENPDHCARESAWVLNGESSKGLRAGRVRDEIPRSVTRASIATNSVFLNPLLLHHRLALVKGWSIDSPTPVPLGHDRDIFAGAKMTFTLHDAGRAMNLDPTRCPRIDALEVVDSESDARIGFDVLVLQRALDIDAADKEPLAVKLKAHRRNIRLSIGRYCRNTREPLRLQVSDFFL